MRGILYAINLGILYRLLRHLFYFSKLIKSTVYWLKFRVGNNDVCEKKIKKKSVAIARAEMHAVHDMTPYVNEYID